VQIPPAALDRLIARWPVGHLATVGDDGHPHVVPVVFVLVDGIVWSPIDGKPKHGATLRRMENLRRHPRCSLLLDHYAADWQALWWVRIDCSGAVLTFDAGAPLVEHALRAKYPQYATIDPLPPPATLLELRPIRHISWSAAPVDWSSVA